MHTPGPWRVWIERTDGRIDTLEICEPDKPHRHSFLASVTKHWPESEANANLIAAAPDLLDALKRLLKIIEEWPSIHEGGDYLHGGALIAPLAAIKKAEGK